VADYGEPWHCVREMKDNGPGEEFTHVAVDCDPGETDPDNGTLVLESPDDARLARAAACLSSWPGCRTRYSPGGASTGRCSGISVPF
jgi:hypothetical protein